MLEIAAASVIGFIIWLIFEWLILFECRINELEKRINDVETRISHKKKL